MLASVSEVPSFCNETCLRDTRLTSSALVAGKQAAVPPSGLDRKREVRPSSTTTVGLRRCYDSTTIMEKHISRFLHWKRW